MSNDIPIIKAINVSQYVDNTIQFMPSDPFLGRESIVSKDVIIVKESHTKNWYCVYNPVIDNVISRTNGHNSIRIKYDNYNIHSSKPANNEIAKELI